MGFVDKFIDNISKNNDSIKRLSDIDHFASVSDWLPSGSPILDWNLNTLGYPVGIIELRGKSQSGKTTFSLLALKNFQAKHPDGIAVILSTERRDNKKYAKKLGLDVEKVIIIACRSIEDVANKTQAIIQEGSAMWEKEGMKGKPKFAFAWDSLGATISSQERKALEDASKDENEDHHKVAMAASARAIKRLFRFLTGEIYDNDIWFMVINHTYDSMQAFGGSKSYGGTAIEFHPTLRLNFSKMGYVKIRDEKLGQTTRITVVKSDYGSYLGNIDIELCLGVGLVPTKDELEFAVNEGILEHFGKGYSFMGGRLSWKSQPELYDLMISENKLLNVLKNKIYKAMHEDVLKKVSDKIDNIEDEE